MPSPSHSSLADSFLDVASRTAAAHGVKFGPGADQDVRTMTIQAAQRVLDEAQTRGAGPDEIERLRNQGCAAFEKLVIHMIAARSTVYSVAEMAANEIGERTLQQAMLRICPLFPIC